MNSERDELLKQEEACLQAISAFLKDGIDGRIAYSQPKKMDAAHEKKRKHSIIVESFAEFWKTCFAAFDDYIQHIDELTLSSHVAVLDDDSANQSRQETDDYSCVTWVSPLEQLIVIYKWVSKEILEGTNSKEACDILFWQLVDKMLTAETEPNKIKYKPFQLDFVPKALNLEDTNVCELLPYLLTAYIFNSQRSHFFNRQERDTAQCTDSECPRRLFQVFSDNPIVSDEASKVRAVAHSFVKNFSLKGYKDPLKNKKGNSLTYNLDEERTARFLGMRNRPYMEGVSYFKYLFLLNDIYANWCRILDNCCPKFEDSSFDFGISYRKSLILYSYYTGQDIHLQRNSCLPDLYALYI